MNAIDAEPMPAVALKEVGADGTAAGANEPEATDSAPEPTEFTARNFTVYAVPFVRPLIVTGDVSSVGDNATHEPAPFN